MALRSPFEGLTPESIKADILAGIESYGAGVDVREGSYANTLVSEAAYALWRYGTKLLGLTSAIFPSQASGEYLDLHAQEVGLVRHAGAKASGIIYFDGEGGAVVPAGTVLLSADGRLRFVTTETATLYAPPYAPSATIGGATVTLTATAAVAVEAGDVGAAYNVAAQEISKFALAVPGVLRVWNPDALAGGADPESDADLYERYHERLTLPITSGNAAHYEYWAKEVSGVACVRVEPLWDGNGTVRVIVGDAARQPLDASVISAVAEHIAAEKPIGATVTTISVAEKLVSVSAQVALLPGVSLAAVRSQFAANLGELLSSLPFAQAQTVPHSRFITCLASTPGVSDFDTLLINGAAAALELADGESPTLVSVTIEEAI